MTGQKITSCMITSRHGGRRVEILMTGMVLKKNPRNHLLLHKGLFGGDGTTHIEAVGLMGDDANSTKCILDTLKNHCKPRSNEILAATAYKQLVQGTLVFQST